MPKKAGRPKGAKTNKHRHKPHRLIQIHRTNPVETIDDFCVTICPKANPVSVQEVLEMIKENKLKYGTITDMRIKHNIPEGAFNSIINRLKDLGIMTIDWNFGSRFQKRLYALSKFYAKYTNKLTPCQIDLKEAEERVEYLKNKISGEEKEVYKQ